MISCDTPNGTATLNASRIGGSSARVLTVTNSTLLLEGAILTGGWWAADRFGGGGVLVSGSLANVTLRRCAIVDCATSQSGGGVDVYRGRLTLEESSVRHNRALGGAGLNLYFSPSVALTGSVVAHNVATRTCHLPYRPPLDSGRVGSR